MTDRVLPVAAILAAGIGLGFAADELLRAPGGPGLNVFLLFVGLVASVWIVTQRSDSPLSREASSWIGVGLLCGAALLLLVVVASATQRMLVYQTAYGLTEERVVVTATLVWLTLVVVWFGATVFSGRRHRFAFGGLVTAFVLVGTLQLIDPAGLVARHNLDRTAELGGVDADYLGTLGSDAAPLLVARLDELPGEAQCLVASRLLRQWGPERSADWRSFNWSDSRARHAVDDDLGTLRRLAGRSSCTGREQ
jgi:hypothetical protein